MEQNEIKPMRTQIFYGAGQNAREHAAQWLDAGYDPVCFADADPTKQHTNFEVPQARKVFRVIPLKEALRLYPDCDLYLTLARHNLKAVTEELMANGIAVSRIKYFEPIEYRLGCGCLGTMFLIGEKIAACCVPGYLKVGTQLTSDAEENYQSYQRYFMQDLLSKWRAGNAGQCQGCPYLHFDLWDSEPQIRELNISSLSGSDYCNAKCIYCSHYPRPSQSALEKRKEQVVGMLAFFAEKFPERKFHVAVSGGDISVAPFRKELFEILKQNGWTACFMTNAAIYCEEISEILRKGGSNVLVTLDSTVPELYAKCKGIHSLPKVMENLRRSLRRVKHG